MSEKPDQEVAGSPAGTSPPASVGWPIMSMMIILLILLIVIGSGFQSSPYTQRQLMLQPIAFFAALALFLANLLAFGFPKMRLPTFVAAAIFLVLLIVNNGI